jgi:hypothetical protein
MRIIAEGLMKSFQSARLAALNSGNIRVGTITRLGQCLHALD